MKKKVDIYYKQKVRDIFIENGKNENDLEGETQKMIEDIFKNYIRKI